MKNIWVYTDTQHGWVNVDDTKFLDIEETPYGDAMTFKYLDREYSSNVVIGSKPGR